MHCLSSGYSPLFTSGLLQERDPSKHTFDQSRRHTALAPSQPISLALPPHASFRRTSRESMRTLPSPKPAPSTTLPAPPVPSASRTAPPSPRRPRTSPFLVPSSQKRMHSLSTSQLSVFSPTPSSSSHRASRSTSPSELDPALLSPRSPIFSIPAHSLSSVARSESISSSAKGRSRMDALACLEGRGRRRHRRLRGNFMSWSDDEDDQPCSPKEHPNPDICIEDVGALGDVEDEDESDAVVSSSDAVPVLGAVPIPQSSQRHVRRKRSWKRISVSPARSAPPSSRVSLSPAVPLSHPASVSAPTLSPTAGPTPTTVSPSTATTSRPQFISASVPSSRERQRRGTIDSWFALRSFIDLRADSDERATAARTPSSPRSASWNWRSFIEIGA